MANASSVISETKQEEAPCFSQQYDSTALPDIKDPKLVRFLAPGSPTIVEDVLSCDTFTPASWKSGPSTLRAKQMNQPPVD